MADGTAVKTCGECEHAAFGSSGTWCTFFNEDVWNEIKVAAECGEYTPTSWAKTKEAVSADSRRTS